MFADWASKADHGGFCSEQGSQAVSISIDPASPKEQISPAWQAKAWKSAISKDVDTFLILPLPGHMKSKPVLADAFKGL